jgi:hypothetical protein
MKTVPLCWLHHVGVFGIHTMGKKAFERRFISQDAMLGKTEYLLQGDK